MDINTVTRHYLIAALWSSNDDVGEPLDYAHDLDSLAPESIAKAQADCRAFVKECAELLTGLNDEQVGHDFWLTRNHHGAGFWDRDLGAVGYRLTEVSHSFGECSLYEGDDGFIYMQPGA